MVVPVSACSPAQPVSGNANVAARRIARRICSLALGVPALALGRDGALPHFIVGMTNSAPSLVPEGQRAVTVLVLV